MGTVAEAVAAFEQALPLSPHNRIARKNLQRLSDRSGAARKATGQNNHSWLRIIKWRAIRWPWMGKVRPE